MNKQFRMFCSTTIGIPVLSVWLFLFLIPAHAVADTQGFDFGFQHRARFVDFDNIIDYTDTIDDHNQFYRFRTRMWGRLVREKLEMKLTLANEFRYYNEPDRDNNYDEIYVDECYLKLPGLMESGWSLAVGRQNIIKGDGFLFFDGSPLDGSRSIYFNSLILSRTVGSSTLDFIGIANPAKDRFLPRIGDKEKALIEHDEAAFGIYFTHKQASDAVWEATYFHKTETSPFESHEQGFKPERSMHIAGGRVAIPQGQANVFTCELAGEFGEEDPDRTITAWAGHATWKHKFETSISPSIKVSAAAFSGDDPDTERDEGWTPPFSRWPEWSELYIYSLVRERGVAWWSNLWFAGAEFTMTPVKSVTMRINYYKLMALQSPAAASGVFGTGRNRGDLFEFRTDFTIIKGLIGHALYEYHLPGNFYSDDEAGHFLRFELTWQFSHLMPF